VGIVKKIFKRRVTQPFVNGLLYSQAHDYVCQDAIERPNLFAITSRLQPSDAVKIID